MKLEELAQQLGVAPEALEIEGVGKLSALAQEIQNHKAELEKAKGYLSQYQQWATYLTQQQQAAQGLPSAWTGGQSDTPEWATDPLLQPIAPVISRLEQQLVQQARYIQQIEAAGKQMLNKYEVAHLKSKYGEDFNEDRIREYAVKHNDGRDWESVYHAERGTRVDDIVRSKLEGEKKAGRVKVARDLEGVHTEMGGAPSRTPPQEKPVSYEESWQKMLVPEFEELGFS